MLDTLYIAQSRLQEFLSETPFDYRPHLHTTYDVFLKREDLQPIRSYKIRGALNCMLRAIRQKHRRTFICASAGNHAQGVAYAANLTGCKAVIVMPEQTPTQKIEAVKRHGNGSVSIELHGANYDESYRYARTIQNGDYFIHPFDDDHVIAGQGTVGLSLLDKTLDAVLVPIGGGGLCAGIAHALEGTATQVIGVQMQGAASMYESLRNSRRIRLDSYDTFVDGACVSTPGERNFNILRKLDTKVVLVNETQVCDALLSLYNKEGVLCELAGAMSIAALSQITLPAKSRVCCVVSGGNNDVRRFPQILERSSWHLDYKSHKIYKR